MNNEIKEYPKEQQKLKDYLDNVTIEQIIDKLKDDDGMTWWVDYQDQYQPNWKKIYAKEVQLLLDYITNLQQAVKNTKETADDMLYELNEENKRLNNGFCELKVKCNKGEIDCTHEEYEGMIQANMKCASLLEDYKSRIEKAIPMLKELNIKLKDILNIGINIKEISDIENVLNGRSDE